jgi:GT2 family glycosyltransferase
MSKFSDLVTIVCVTWNNLDYFQSMTFSLCSESEDKDIKLVVHVNEDKKTERYCKLTEDISYTFSEINQGIFQPLNNLINLVETPYVLFWADDILFLKDWDKYLLKVLSYYKQYNEDNIWISPRLIEPINCFAPQEHPYCTIKDFGRKWDEFNDKYSEEELENLRSKDNQIRKLPNGNMIMSVKAFKELGGYDLNYKAGADSDLTWRFVKKYGTDGIKQVSKSLCYHFGSIVTNKNKEKREEFERQGRELFGTKYGFWIGDITKKILENNILIDSK